MSGTLLCFAIGFTTARVVSGASAFDVLDRPTARQLLDAEARMPYETKYRGGPAVLTPQHSVTSKQSTLHDIFLVPHTHDDVGWLYTVGGCKRVPSIQIAAK